MFYKRMALVLLLAWSVFNAEANINYKTVDLQTKQLKATLYLPEVAGAMLAIVVLGGSSGRRNTVYSELMANHIVVYLKKHGFKDPVQHLCVDDNHFIDTSTLDGFAQQLVDHLGASKRMLTYLNFVYSVIFRRQQ